MSAVSSGVVSPEPDNAEKLAEVLSFIERHEERYGVVPEPAFFLAGAGEGDRVELTEQVYGILKGVVAALSRGQSVSILARDQEISTQQAAEILGLSRPTIVRLIDDGELPAHVPGATRRKLRLADVLAYREQLHERRNQFITDSSAAFEDIDEDDANALLAEARRKR